MRDLKLLTFIDASFSDVSINLNNYDVDSLALSLSTGIDYLYFGLHKKFKNLFIEVSAFTSSVDLIYEYYDGSIWKALDVIDETNNLERSGFISWELPTDWGTADVDSNNLFFIRVTATAVLELSGVNMLFSNDNDLREKYRNINDFKGGDLSYVAYQQSSRKDILQEIKNSGNTKISSIDNRLEDLTIWDFLRPQQLRNASAYLCISKIFSGLSDSIEGKYYQLAMDNEKKYRSALNTFLLTIDKNDDGEEDSAEANNAISHIRIIDV